MSVLSIALASTTTTLVSVPATGGAVSTTTLPMGDCPADPRPDCRDSDRATMLIKDRDGADADVLTWRWASGEPVDALSLGDPTADTTYQLCVYGGTPTGRILASQIAVPPGGSWAARGTGGFRYKNRAAVFDGVTAMVATTGGAHDARAQVRGRRAALPLPGPSGMDRYFENGLPVTVQLGNSRDGCWRADFPAPKNNTAERFVAKTR